MMKSSWIFLLSLILVRPVLAGELERPEWLQAQWQGHGYSVKIYRDDDSGEGCVDISQNGKQVFYEEGNQYTLGLIYEDMPESSLVTPGKDITGDGVPDLVISHWSGGAHCCFDYNVFSLGEQFKPLAKIENNDGDYGKFIDVDKDGVLEFVGNDYTFGYWHAPFSASPAPEVILRFNGGEYVLAPDLMARPLPTPDQQEAVLMENTKAAESLCHEDYLSWQRDGVCVTSPIWMHMLNLIYTGHPDEAWKFLDRGWAGTEETKKWFVYDFKKRLASSPYAERLPVDLFGFDSVAEDRLTEYLKTMQKIRTQDQDATKEQ